MVQEKGFSVTWPLLQPEGGYIFYYLKQGIQEDQEDSGFSAFTKSILSFHPKVKLLNTFQSAMGEQQLLKESQTGTAS